MTLTAGTLIFNSFGEYTGDGLIKSIMDAYCLNRSPNFTDADRNTTDNGNGGTFPPLQYTELTALYPIFLVTAQGVISYLTANAVVSFSDVSTIKDTTTASCSGSLTNGVIR